MYFLLGLLSLGIASQGVYSQNIYKQLFGKVDSTEVHDHSHGGWIYLPVVFYSPDTRLGFGGLVGRYFHLAASKTDTVTRLSYVKLFADYTLNKQVDVWNSFNIFFPNETYMIKGEARYKTYPDKYYGIGNRILQRDSLLSHREPYTYNQFAFNINAFRRIRPQMFVGFNYEFNTYFHLRSTSDHGEIASGTVSGSEGGITSGLGFVYSWDKRENLFNSRTGMFLEAKSTFFTPILGSDYTYQNFRITYNRYYPIKREAAFAFQVVGNFNTGNTPFFNMAPVGSSGILRGYARNLYRDQNMVGAQAEFRFPIWWRFGGVSFVGFGDVFNSTADLSFNRIKYSYGAGLRIMLDSHERVNLRLDYGFGRQSRGFYFSIGESF